jgi:hypothetical protein
MRKHSTPEPDAAPDRLPDDAIPAQADTETTAESDAVADTTKPAGRDFGGLEVMVKPATTEHPALYFVPTTIRIQRRSMQTIAQIGLASSDIEGLDLLLALAETLIFQPAEAGGYEPVPQDLISDRFDAVELMTLIQDRCGLNRGQ